MSAEVVVTDAGNDDYINITRLLDEDLYERYGETQKAYDKLNHKGDIRLVILVYLYGEAVACGAMREYDPRTVEIKRIFVKSPQRGKGFAKLVLNKLEETAKCENYQCAILETGIKQSEAVGLYRKCGYSIIKNYGPYAGNPNSICMKKLL